MDNTKLQTLKGFRDFLPQKMVVRNEAIKRLKSVFEKYGFEELQTPSLEYQEVLLGKYGEEAEKLMYLFEDPGGRKVGLRYDLTVPTARVISNNPDFPKPFKRYQIQPAWRAENTQKGRYREFYQCDIDTFGSASPLADGEILAVISNALEVLEITNYKIRINSRNVLFASMEKAGIAKEKWLTTIQSIDKLDKKSGDEVENELRDKGLTKTQINDAFNAIKLAKPDKFLEDTIQYANKMGAKAIVFDSILSRGLDYYTGPIFETVVDTPKMGSVTGGGRYDALLKTLGGPDIPAVGTTIGLDRICDVVEELNLWPNITKSSTKVLVTIFSNDLLDKSMETAELLRESGINTDLYPDSSVKLDKQLKYADKKDIPFVVVIGSDEERENLVTLKNLKTKEQTKVKLDRITELIK